MAGYTYNPEKIKIPECRHLSAEKFAEVNKRLREEIIGALGVPPSLVGPTPTEEEIKNDDYAKAMKMAWSRGVDWP